MWRARGRRRSCICLRLPRLTRRERSSRPLGACWRLRGRPLREHFAPPQRRRRVWREVHCSADGREGRRGEFRWRPCGRRRGDATAMLQRLPLSFEPDARFAVASKLSYGEASVAPAHFERPEGSFEARAFGNAVHAFAEALTKRLADGVGVDALLREVAGWTPRIAAVLRGDGLAPAVVDRLSRPGKDGAQ